MLDFLKSEPFEYYKSINGPLLKNIYGGLDFKNGLSMFVMSSKINVRDKNVVFKSRETKAFGFRFCISGHKKIKMPSFKDEISIKPNQCSFFNYYDQDYLHKLKPRDDQKFFYIIIDPAFTHSLLGDEFKNPVNSSSLPTGDKKGKPFNFTNIITPEMHLSIQQIFNCPYSGLARKFYFEAKVIELISHELDFLKSEAHKTEKLKSTDVELMYHVGELLTRDFQNPAQIDDIVKQAGTSRTKFFKQFREVHGLPPAAYLRRARMEKAKKILKTNNMNITEISNYLGFSSSSHFTRTFKQYYGTSPLIYKKMY